MADPVEDQINFMIDDIDARIAGKYPFKLRDMLEHPADFKDRQNILADVDRMKDDVSGYFKSRLEEVADLTDAYRKDAAKASNAAKGIADFVKSVG